MIFTNRILFMYAISKPHLRGDAYFAGSCSDREFIALKDAIFPEADSNVSSRLQANNQPTAKRIRINGLRISDDKSHLRSVYFVCAGPSGHLSTLLEKQIEGPVSTETITLPCDSYQLVPDNHSFGWQLTETKYVEYVKSIPCAASLLTEEPFLSNSEWRSVAHVSATINNAYISQSFRLLHGQVRNLSNQFLLEWTRWTDHIPPSIPNRAFLKYLAEANKLRNLETEIDDHNAQTQYALRRSCFKLAFGLSD